ncbi:hypothetical protein BD413DRAFT_120973 [Trametes elegans]|nr:hypothetical protein BD413DRAFT_120973 [Trametes elegans]
MISQVCRQAVADVEDLKKKIEQLQNRSKALENALQLIQAAVSDQPHPLLQEGAENGTANSPDSFSSHSAGSPTDVPPLTAEEEDVLDSFG